jgi:hypothetical protein
MAVESPVKALLRWLVPDLQRTAGTGVDQCSAVDSQKKNTKSTFWNNTCFYIWLGSNIVNAHLALKTFLLTQLSRVYFRSPFLFVFIVTVCKILFIHCH